MTAISARETATRLVAGGYSIVPIKHRDKNPGNLLGGGWTSKTVSADSLATAFPEGVARNIGVLNRDCLVVDIDVYDPSLAERILTETLRRHPGGLVRKGQFPKVAVFYRAGEDFSVRDTGKFFLGHEDESGKKLESEVEFRRGGGQTVAYGVHPCGAVYEWVGPSLADVALCDLPSISQADGEALREWALGELMDAAGVVSVGLRSMVGSSPSRVAAASGSS